MATESLQSIGDRAKNILLQNVKSSGNADIDKGVTNATVAELEKGFLRDPVATSSLPAL